MMEFYKATEAYVKEAKRLGFSNLECINSVRSFIGADDVARTILDIPEEHNGKPGEWIGNRFVSFDVDKATEAKINGVPYALYTSTSEASGYGVTLETWKGQSLADTLELFTDIMGVLLEGGGIIANVNGKVDLDVGMKDRKDLPAF